MNTLIIVGVILTLAALVVYQTGFAKAKDVTVAPPVEPRKGVKFGYYWGDLKQPAETKDHVNVFMSVGGGNPMADQIKFMGMNTILHVQWWLWTDKNPLTVHPEAEARIRGLFELLRSAEALHFVKFLYPVDEPNNVTTEDEVRKAIALLMKIAVEYPELAGVKLMCIYAGDKPTIASDCFDVIGIDWYKDKSSILTGKYSLIRDNLLPGQQTVLIPGGGDPTKQDPTPFVNYALSASEVWGILAFTWCNVKAGAGIAGNGMADAYRAAGKQVIGA